MQFTASFGTQQFYQVIGTIQKVHGLKGELIIRLENLQVALPAFNRIFVYLQATYVPYWVDSWQVCGAHALVRLMHVSTRSQAIKLRGYRVFLDKKEINLPTIQKHGVLTGCVVEDLYQGVLGHVVCVYDRMMQPCLGVDYQGKELLIPLHEVFVKRVEVKKITVSLPRDYIGVLLGG